MRILHTSDWHLGKHLDGRSRIEEQEQFLEEFIHIVEEYQVDMVILAGDVYDSSNPPAIAEMMFYDTLKRISKNGERLTLVIAGNHDNPERLVAAGPLAMEHGIIMTGLPKTIVQTGTYGKHKVTNSGEGFIEIEMNHEKAVILLLPFPSEKRLNEVLYQDMDSDEERLSSYNERINLYFDRLSHRFREDTINIAVSHLFAMGSRESGSERGIQLGGSYIVDGSCFPKEAQYIALGHVHKAQVVPGTDHKAYYSGAPIHYHKDESDLKKKKVCFIIDMTAGQPIQKQEVELKIYKPIEKWYCQTIADAIKMCEEKKDECAWVYIDVETEQFIKDEDMKQMRHLKPDIIEIHPIIKADDTVDEIKYQSDKSFIETFKDFFRYQTGDEADDAFVSLLMSVIEGEEEDETANT